jgi:hypothetical protein
MLFAAAFGFMWEKMVGTHEKALWVRLASRLPYRECGMPNCSST